MAECYRDLRNKSSKRFANEINAQGPNLKNFKGKNKIKLYINSK